MKFIQGQSRTRINLFPVSLDQTIDADNEVRIRDLFVDSLPVKDYGFRTDYIAYGLPSYGTIKRQWGFIYILNKKGINRAGSDVGLKFITNNLRRIGNILTMNVLNEYVRILVRLFLAVSACLGRKIRSLESFIFQNIFWSVQMKQSLKSC
jgi:hypothetical protein